MSTYEDYCLRVIGKVDDTTGYVTIRVSVNSLYRDGADAQYMQYLSKAVYFTANTLKAFLSAQSSSLSAFMISYISQLEKAVPHHAITGLDEQKGRCDIGNYFTDSTVA